MTALKGVESYLERTELYENFDIHHHDNTDAESSSDDEIRNAFGSVRTNSEAGLGRAETAADGKPGTAGFPDSASSNYHRNRQATRLLELTANTSSKFATNATVLRGLTGSGSNLRESQTSLRKRKKRYDLRRESGASAADKLVMILEQGKAGSTIYLPAKEIQMPDLRIKRAFRVKGQPGTCLFFKQTTLCFDFSASEPKERDDREFRSMEACIFSEVQLCFWIDMRDVAYRKSHTAARHSAAKATHH